MRQVNGSAHLAPPALLTFAERSRAHDDVEPDCFVDPYWGWMLEIHTAKEEVGAIGGTGKNDRLDDAHPWRRLLGTAGDKSFTEFLESDRIDWVERHPGVGFQERDQISRAAVVRTKEPRRIDPATAI